MFTCSICGEIFDDDDMSEFEDVCIDCYDEESTRELIAIGII